MGGSNAVSEPLTSSPASRKSAASAPMPVPETPTRWTRTVRSALGEGELVARDVDGDDAAGRVGAAQDLLGQRVLQALEDRALERARAEAGLVAEVDQLVFGAV